MSENAYGVRTPQLEYGGRGIPQYSTKTYHGTSIIVNNTVVGRIKSWGVQAYSRQANHVREVSAATWGRPVDLVPGISEGYTISFDRVEVWGNELETALGLGATFNDLADQTRPFEILEQLFKGSELYMCWQYTGCWLTARNENARTAEGDGIVVIEGGEIKYVSRKRVLGSGGIQI